MILLVIFDGDPIDFGFKSNELLLRLLLADEYTVYRQTTHTSPDLIVLDR